METKVSVKDLVFRLNERLFQLEEELKKEREMENYWFNQYNDLKSKYESDGEGGA